MKLLHHIDSWWDRKLAGPTVQQAQEEELQRATVELQQARAMIHNQRFVAHLARAKIAALKAWDDEQERTNVGA